MTFEIALLVAVIVLAIMMIYQNHKIKLIAKGILGLSAVLQFNGVELDKKFKISKDKNGGIKFEEVDK